MIESSRVTFRSYFSRWHCTNIFRNVLSASSCHLEVIVCTSWEANALHFRPLQTLLHVSVIGVALWTVRILPARMRRRKYNPACVKDEVSISDILREELNMSLIWKMKYKVQVKNRPTHRQKVSVRVKQVLYVLMGVKTRNSNAYTFTKHAGP
jgi:hypothetical protein